MSTKDQCPPPTYTPPVVYHQAPPVQPPVYHQAPPVQPPMVTQAPMAPAPVNQMCNNTVVVNQPSSSSDNRFVVVSKEQLNTRDWNSGMCGCLNDILSCALGMFCLPLLMCRLANRLNECALLPFCTLGGFMALRTKLRIMGGIQGTICGDCVLAHCCGPCVACQMARELDDMKL